MGSSSGGTPRGGADSGVDSGGPPTSSGSGSGSSSGGVAHDAGGAADTGGGSRHDAGGNNPSPEAGDDSGRGDDATDGPSEGGTVTVPDTKVVMYIPNWNGSFSSWASMIDFTKMTHLLLAFGTTGSSNDWNLGASDSDVQAIAAAAHANNVKVLVSIGGASDDIGIINQYQDASNIGPLVSNLDAFVSRLNLDGVDVDLERGSQMQSSSNYPPFIKQLMSTFHPEGKLVTTALAQYIVQDANSDAALQAVIQSFDFINDMIYTTNMSDYTSEASWWISTQGIAKTQLVWGIQFGNNLSADTAKQIATASKGYGGTMIWEYTQPSEPQLWPAVQSVF